MSVTWTPQDAGFPPLPGLGTPRCRVIVNGVPVQATVDLEVTHNNHYRADTFSATIAMGAENAVDGPFDPSVAGGGQAFKSAWWAAQTDAILVQCQMALLPPGQNAPGAGDWVTLVSGEVDDIDLNLDAQTVQITGRDVSRRLIDAKTQESFVNQTSSQIATTLAGRHRLKANVAQTTTPVGYFYQLEHDRLSLGSLHRATTEWNMLVWLAEHEHFDVWISPLAGNVGAGPYDAVLNFQPAVDPSTAPVFIVDYFLPGNPKPYPLSRVQNLRFSRSMGLAKGVEVTVLSWQSKARAPTKATVGHAGKDTQKFVFLRPNLTSADALKEANALLANISKHERKVTLSMPGELSVAVRNIVRIDGTNTAFDQDYYIDSFTRRMSVSGFDCSMRLSNQSPEAMGAESVVVT